MAKKILIKRSSVAGKVPTTSDLEIGELAINLVDQIIYTKRISPQDGVTEEIIPVGGAGNGGDGAAIYEILLAASDFAQETFSIFDESSPEPQLAENTGSYDSINRYYKYNTNEYFTTNNIIEDGNSYSVFEIFVNTPQDTANYKIEYSIDGGSNWTEISEPYRVYLDSDTSDFRFKFTALADDTVVYGYGVLYDLQGLQGTNNVAFDVSEVLSSDISAGTVYELPGDVVYNNDGKSLNVYRNGFKLIEGMHYTEEDNRHIKWLIDLQQNDVLEFKQYYGYVFIDESNKAYMAILSWNYVDVNSDYTAKVADYIFADTSGGSIQITLPANPGNGDTVYILDVKGTFDIKNVSLVPEGSNGETIMGDSSAYLDIKNKEYKIIFNSLNNDWRIV